MTYENVQAVLQCLRDIVQFHDIDLTSVHQRGMFDDTPLVVVAGWGDVDAARLLLDAGADLNTTGEDGDTPLHRAIEAEHPEMIEFLLEHGANVDVENAFNHTAAMLGESSRDARIRALFTTR